jgi:hypothetical protein
LDSENSERKPSKAAVHPEEGKKYDDFQLSYALDRLNGNSPDAVSH